MSTVAVRRDHDGSLRCPGCHQKYADPWLHTECIDADYEAEASKAKYDETNRDDYEPRERIA